ncbi:MAG: ABC transporter permease [Thiocapsa sp.]|nr:ABC transporter permease [Thiocapsa sp.]MCG6897253.1 ABC transporter permease [Thiocapsa sp.]MCG6983983.1 ABC transporter permease [Thiocapsa sp.]
MNALTRKLLREAWRMRGQAVAIAVVIAGGVSTLLMALSSLDALTLTRNAFYRDYRFADLFVTLERAPESLREEIEAIPGVQQVETRVVAGVNLDIPDFDDPATGMLISLPDGRNAALNRLYIREGRLPEPDRDRDLVVSQAFADAHGFHPGDQLSAIINGRRQALEIVGIALSPEHIYQIKPGDLFPDFARHGVLWMNRTQLANAYDMDGAFNSLTVSLRREARIGDVIERLDLLLAPYGGLGAIPREEQISDRYLSSELDQLGAMARLFPAIFLGVAAFLLNVVFGRLIGTQREQIAILKAFGYTNRQIGLHYSLWVLLIVALGLTIGLAAGTWLGRQMAELYRGFFHFPYLDFCIRPATIIIGILVTLLAGIAGALAAVRRAVLLPPAEAMRPEAPPVFRPTLVERLGLQRCFNQRTRMILRNIERRPFKAMLSVIGIAMACGILMVGRFQEGALDYLIQVQYGLAQRDDLALTFVEPTSRRAMQELASLSGVYRVEPVRAVAVRLRHGPASYLSTVQGIESPSILRRVLDDRLGPVELPPAGLVLSDFLAGVLNVRPGGRVTLEVLEGRRDVLEVPVTGVVQELIGVAAYMDLQALNRLLKEGRAISGALLAVSPGNREAIVASMKETPRVAGVTDRLTAVESFTDSMGQIVLTFAFISTLLAGSIAVGVVYSNARIALTERSRELASLRVLGFSRGEIAYVLLGELALITLAAIPVGFIIGTALIVGIVHGVESDLYRIPLVIVPSVYAFAATVVVLATLLSGLIVSRQLGRLDLLSVLKTRE